MKKIDKNNRIFKSNEFLKDQYMFNILLKNLDSKTLELYSDEANYIICRGSLELPTWIWTKDNFDILKIEEIEKLIELYLTNQTATKYTCKKELYKILVERKFRILNLKDYFEMGFLICEKTKKPKNCDGKLEIPSNDDRETLVKYRFDDCQEINGIASITIEQVEKDIDELLKQKNIYILKNNNNVIVSMASYEITGNQAKISHVYTPVNERRKGYASNLIYYLTNELLIKDYIPLLYTDFNYIPSNKAYINAGYENKGILINFSCSRNKCTNYNLKEKYAKV